MAFSNLLSQWRFRKGLRFQVMSDLHLEVGNQYESFEIVPHATHLILAGDIGRLADYKYLRSFLCSVCQKFEQVYLVLGNHEFFGISRQEGLQLADRLQEDIELKDKLVVMNRKRVDLQGVTILGCTLHSRIPIEAEEIVQNKVNDFRRIIDWTVSNHSEEHAADVEWLETEIISIRKMDTRLCRKIVVISHHAPIIKGSSKPSDEGNPWSSAFATDLIGNKDKSPLDDVQWWVFGHTHYCTEFICGQIKLVSNQRGYVLPNKDNGTDDSAKVTPKILKILGGGRQKQYAFYLDKIIEV
jgi:hypothetical protein